MQKPAQGGLADKVGHRERLLGGFLLDDSPENRKLFLRMRPAGRFPAPRASNMGAIAMRRYRARARFIRDHKPYSTPLDRNGRARILALAEALERRTRPVGGRNGVVGQVGLRVLRALLLGFMRGSDGLCCPSYRSIQRISGLSSASIASGLKRLEAAGVLRIVRRLKRAVVEIGGMARLTTVQTTSLYSFFEPSPVAHLLPVTGARTIKPPVARLLSSLCGAWASRADFSSRRESQLKLKLEGFSG